MIFKKKITEFNDKEKLETIESQCERYIIQRETIKGSEKAIWGLYDTVAKQEIAESFNLKDLKSLATRLENARDLKVVNHFLGSFRSGRV